MRNATEVCIERQDAASIDEKIDEPKEKKKRVWEIDFIRGVAILGMVIDHAIYDLANLQEFFYNYYSVGIDWINQMGISLTNWYNGGRQNFHNFAILFFLICGISSTFSKNNWKHSLKILLSSFVLSAGSYVIYHISYAVNHDSVLDFRLLFGVLYALGMGTLFVSLVPQIFIWAGKGIEFIKEKIAEKRGETYTKKKVESPSWIKWVYLGLGLSLIISWIIYTYSVVYPSHHITFNDPGEFWYWWIRKYDSASYEQAISLYSPQRSSNWFQAVFGLNFGDFVLCALGFRGVGSDFFSLIPWVGWTLIGAFLGKTIYKNKESLFPKLDGKWNKPFAWVGFKSLWVYILHQPLLVVLIAIVFCPMGYRFF